MKRILSYAALVCAAGAVLVSCGQSAETKGYETNDLRYIPLKTEEGLYTYVDTETGEAKGSYEEATLYRDGLALVRPEGSEGYIYVDHNQEKAIEDTFASASIFSEGIAWVARKGGHLEAIDTKGKRLFELKEAEGACAFKEGVAVFMRGEDGAWGVVNKKGEVVVKPSFTMTSSNYDGGLLAVGEPDGGIGFVNKKGEVVIPMEYDQVLIEEWDRFIDNPTRYNLYGQVETGRIPVKKNGKWGVINRSGKWIINPQFDLIVADGERYLFRKDWKYGWCDEEGKYVINPQFENALPSEGYDLMAVKDGSSDEYGYINAKGKWVIEPQYELAMPFLPSGVAFVYYKGEWGAIDRKGEWVINPQYLALHVVSDNLALVMDSGEKIGLINSKGEYVVAPEYSDCSMELLTNRYGQVDYVAAESDYVDVAGMAQTLVTAIRKLKTVTTGELKKEIGESKFRKGGGDVKIERAVEDDMVISVTAPDVNAWNRVSDGWFGYNYVFRPDVKISSFTLTVSMIDKAARFVSEIAEATNAHLAQEAGAETKTEGNVSVTETKERKVIVAPGESGLAIVVETK